MSTGHPYIGLYNLFPWYPALYGMIGPTNKPLQLEPAFTTWDPYKFDASNRNILPNVKPYIYYQYDPVFVGCAFSPYTENNLWCRERFGSYIYDFDRNPLQ